MTRSQCSTSSGLGKRGWHDKKAAKRAAKSYNSQPHAHHKVEPYRCGECGLWHLGRSLTKEEKRRRRQP